MSSPVISVLMPAYNTERYVAEAVESILGQTFTEFEFIIVDDGSTDGSLAVLRRYAAQDSRIRLVSRPNTGIVGALNEGLSLAQGELIARMDGDDVSLPKRLELQVAYLDDHPRCVAVGCRVLMVDPDGAPLRITCEELEHDEIVAAELRGWTAIENASATYRRCAVMEAGGYRKECETAEDLDLFLRLAERGDLANLPDVLYEYRQHFRRICHCRRGEQARITREVLKEARARRGLPVPNDIMAPDVSGVLSEADQHRTWAWWALRAGHVRTARKHALAAVLKAPLSRLSWRVLACSIRGQ